MNAGGPWGSLQRAREARRGQGRPWFSAQQAPEGGRRAPAANASLSSDAPCAIAARLCRSCRRCVRDRCQLPGAGCTPLAWCCVADADRQPFGPLGVLACVMLRRQEICFATRLTGMLVLACVYRAVTQCRGSHRGDCNPAELGCGLLQGFRGGLLPETSGSPVRSQTLGLHWRCLYTSSTGGVLSRSLGDVHRDASAEAIVVPASVRPWHQDCLATCM